MSTHNICFDGEIRKILVLLGWKKLLTWSYDYGRWRDESQYCILNIVIPYHTYPKIWMCVFDLSTVCLTCADKPASTLIRAVWSGSGLDWFFRHISPNISVIIFFEVNFVTFAYFLYLWQDTYMCHTGMIFTLSFLTSAPKKQWTSR